MAKGTQTQEMRGVSGLGDRAARGKGKRYRPHRHTGKTRSSLPNPRHKSPDLDKYEIRATLYDSRWLRRQQSFPGFSNRAKPDSG